MRNEINNRGERRPRFRHCVYTPIGVLEQSKDIDLRRHWMRCRVLTHPPWIDWRGQGLRVRGTRVAPKRPDTIRPNQDNKYDTCPADPSRSPAAYHGYRVDVIEDPRRILMAAPQVEDPYLRTAPSQVSADPAA